MSSVQFGPEVFNHEYRVSSHTVSRNRRGSLVDRGANGGIIGNDAIVILQHQRQVDVTGIDNHELNALKIVDASAKATSQHGDVILILRQYAYHGVGRTIHSAGQIEHYKNIVDDKSMKVGGRQCIRTSDGYILPLDIINGLPYLKMYPNSRKEWDTLPHVILTSGDDWNPKVIDHDLTNDSEWINVLKDLDEGSMNSPFDEYGNYRKRQPKEPTEKLPPVDEPEDNELNFMECFKIASDLNQRYIVCDYETIEPTQEVEVKKKPVDYSKYRPYFLHVPEEKIRKTFENTTQNATNIVSGHNILQTTKSPFPAHNVFRRHEPVATDTFYAETPAICGGDKMAQLFVGRKSLFISVHGMSTEKEFVNTLEDEIRKRGAMDKLISDSAEVEISARVKDILRALCIDDWQSEAQYQHQNFAEHRWKHFKRNVQWFMNFRNVDANAWLLCCDWVADVMNHTVEKSLRWRTPMEVLTGQTTDISIMLCFLFWDVVYVKRYKDKDYRGQVGSVKSSEIRGRFVGFAWNVGHALTFKILTDDTKKIICRSRVRLAKEMENNLKLDTEAGAVPEREHIKSKRDERSGETKLPTIDVSTDPFSVEFEDDDVSNSKPQHDDLDEEDDIADEDDEDESPMDQPLKDLPEVTTVDDDEDLAEHLRDQRKPGAPNPDLEPLKFKDTLENPNPTVKNLTPDQLVGRSFLMPPTADGSRVRAKIVEKIQQHKKKLEEQPDLIRFKCKVNGEYEDIVAYNDICDYIEDDEHWGGDGEWRFKAILDHKNGIRPGNKEYRGCSVNLLVEWEGGEKTWEPLTTKDKIGIMDTDEVTVAIYAKKHNLLHTPGWKHARLRSIAKSEKQLRRHANQAKLHSFRTKPIYMYGFQVPRNYAQAIELDRANGNNKWQEATDKELAQIDEYETFEDKGKGYRPSHDYKKITVHLVYAVKHDGRHKARLVAGGHLTETPIDSVYSSVVSLRGIRMLTFISELNEMDVWATDIGNAYLESFTKEKVYIIAGSEFGDRAGHTLVIRKALYGLKSSGLRWHERFADVLRGMDFFPSKAEYDIWMRDRGDHYEYIAVYVDDLLICSKDPRKIISALEDDHKFKLKGTGPISFHLGCDFYRDTDGVLCYEPKKYINKMLDNYQRIFGCLPTKRASPLEANDHPELDTSELLDIEWTKIYQSLIGALQWVIQIGRWDISTAVMTLSRFRAAPRQGHLDRAKRIHGYLRKMRHGVNRIRTEAPDYSNIPEKVYEWENTVYRGAKEEIPADAPRPLGESIVQTSYVDANLYHDLISGRSVTGDLQIWNKTIIDAYSKLQSTVETATFGSEYVATRTSAERILDLRNTARYLGVKVEGPTMVFGDNESVVNTASMPDSRLTKRHIALSYHKVRWCIAAKVIRYYHIRGKTNPADIVSKHWAMPAVWDTLKPLLFWQGDTAELAKSDSGSNGEQRNQDDSPSLSRGVKDDRATSLGNQDPGLDEVCARTTES